MTKSTDVPPQIGCDPSSDRCQPGDNGRIISVVASCRLLALCYIVLDSHRIIMSKSVVRALLLSLLFSQSDAFAPTLPFTKYAAAANSARVAPSDRVVATGSQHAAPSSPVALHMIDPLQSSLLVAAAEPWVQPTISVLDPFLNLFSFAMVRKTLRYSSSSSTSRYFMSRC
jgi:hypothetical protein